MSLLQFAKLPKDQIDALFWHIINNFTLNCNSDKDSCKKSTLENSGKSGVKDSSKTNAIDQQSLPSELIEDNLKSRPIQPENYRFLENLSNYITKGTM